MHEEKPTGKLGPKQEAALERQIEQAKPSYMPSIVRHEDDGSMTKMTLATVESVRNMQEEIDNLRQRCSDLKHALGEGADWSYRAISAEKRAARMCLVVEQFCRQCEDGDEPGSCADCLLQPYGGGKQ